ncbi:MAG: hypothetical protein AABX32_07125 [Nanoarchaeota archaeon]
MEKQIGNYSFIVGVIVALVLGLASKQVGAAQVWLLSLLVLLGLVVGFLNVSGKDTKDFLMVTVALVVVAFAAKEVIAGWTDVKFVGPYLSGVFVSLLTFVVPASIVVALKEVYQLAKE